MSRDRDSKSLQDKLKVFFKKGASAPLSTRNELSVTAELERELGPETPLHRRIRSLKDLGEKALRYRIHEGDVNKLWCCTRDLLEEPGEARHAALGFLRCVAEGQAEHLSLARTLLFSYLTRTHANMHPDDEVLRFKLLHTLTNTGKNITSFEELIGPFLVEWLSQIHNCSLSVEMLQLIMNVVKFNASYLDEEVVHSIVVVTCQLCEQCSDVAVTAACLDLLEAVLSYSLLPRASLDTFVITLCRTVNLEHCSRTSWKLMRYVLNADMGAMCVASLCALAGAPRGAGAAQEAGALRGAVFYLNMALWGARRVPPHAAPHAVLPRLLQAVDSGHAVVVYEVVAGLCAAALRPLELHQHEWTLLLRVLAAVAHYEQSLEPRNDKIHEKLHSCISSIEALLEAGQFRGEPTQLLQLVQQCAPHRPEASVMRLITLQANALSPTNGGWISGALDLCSRYIRNEPRRTVREHALNALKDFIVRYRVSYGEEVTELLTLPLLSACACDAACGVREAAARLLPELALHAPAHHLPDFIDILEKILNRPFETNPPDKILPPEADLSDLSAAVSALLALLRARMLASPGAHPARCLLVLLQHLDATYRRALLQHHPAHRAQILEMLFLLRVNAYNCVGLAEAAGSEPACSPFLLVEPCAPRGQPAPPQRDLPPGACLFPAGRVARAVLAALSREAQWAVLARVLAALPALLHQRALAVPRRAQELTLLAATLCQAVSERVVTGGGGGGTGVLGAAGGGRLLVSELHAAMLPALCALAPYHAYLEPPTQQRIVRCLIKYGMVLRNPQAYIHALSIYTLEMRDTMVKMLPEVLLELSKITPTKLIAAPMLEFLSTLTRLPRVFASFVEDQYMSVFAILLPYTNPSRYEHYEVALAHHVIAAWFLKCRLSYRRNFVRFIIHGLHNYIIKPFEEQLQRAPVQLQANEDSSTRQRSSSLGSRVRGVGMAGAGGAGVPRAGGQSAAFHVELTETCVDLLARYTFTPATVRPQRSDTAEFLFTGGQSMTWLVGHKLVTITTSGCLQNSIKQGLCERCSVLCRQHAESAASPLPPLQATNNAQNQNEETNGETANKSGNQLQVQSQTPAQTNPPEIKRYSKSSLQHSRSCDAHSQAEPPVAPPTVATPLAPVATPTVSLSGHSSRQNSSENKSTDPLLEALNHFSERFEKVSKEVDGSGGGLGRAGALAAAGACPCWCGNWAELHVRSATGDVAWLMRMQNQMNWESVMESPLQDVAALLMPVPAPAPPTPPTAPGQSHSTASSTTSAASTQAAATAQQSQANTFDAARADAMRARSGSASARRSTHDLHKSSSDSVVERRTPPAAPHQPIRTAPINIPGSPQRQCAPAHTDDDDLLLVVPEGKSRHPVRRSNSSPEMSSSWKLPPRAPAPEAPPPAPAPAQDSPVLREMLVLPSCEPTGGAGSANMLASKKASKKSDMRVSCEAIPEEMSGTSPHPHPHLATYKSDPGAAGEAPRANVDPHQLQKTASDSTVSGRGGATSSASTQLLEELPPLARSKRSNTISVMSPTRRRREAMPPRPTSGAVLGGMTPAFVFLQLYHNMSTYPTTPPVPGESATHLSPLLERPLRVTGDQHERTIKTLDLLPPLETYKIGVLYVGPGQQDDEVQILKNEYGSVRYSEFVRQLGTLVSLDEEQPHLFLNLERGGSDGHYTYVWQDDIMQVLFHVATAMPTSERDPVCNEKRKYIGNDYVSIVYNNSGADFNIHTIKGQFNVCIVVVEPLAHGLHRVLVKSKDATPRAATPPPATVADANVAVLARQRALHASLASQISASLSRGGAAFASNCLERLRAIKRLRRRCEAERAARAAPEPYALSDVHHRVAIDDFNDYT